MQEEMIKLFVKDTNHETISKLPGISSAVAKVKAGTVLFEMQGVSEEVAREAMRLASHKLPVKCKFIKREDA